MHRDDRSGSCRSLSPPFAKPRHYKGCGAIPEIRRLHSIISGAVGDLIALWVATLSDGCR